MAILTKPPALTELTTLLFFKKLNPFLTFYSASGLQGQAYTASKTYGSQVFSPIFKGLIMLSDAVKSSTAEMPAAYVSEVGGERLDSETLSADITELTASIDNYQMLLSNEEAKETVSQATVNSIKASINSEMVQRKTLQDKLAKLLAFDATSPTYFSKIPGLASAVDAGLSQLQAGVTSFNGTFTLPSQKELEWTKTVNSEWEEWEAYLEAVDKGKKGEELNDKDVKAIEAYQKRHSNVKIDRTVEAAKDAYTVDKNYQDVVKKIDNGEVLTEADVVVISAYAKGHPDVKPPKKVVDALDEYYYGFDDIPETLISKSLDWKEWGWASVGKVLDDADEIAIKQGKNLGRVFGAKLQPRDALGRFVKDTIKPRAWLSGKLKGMSNGTSKLIGHGAKFLGFGVSAALEGFDHYSKHKNVGRAVSYGAVGGAVAVGAGLLVGSIGAAFAAPAGLVFVAGVVVSAVASAGLKVAYENIKPVKDVIDGAGDLLNKGGKVVSDGVKSIGKAFSNPIGSLKGAFGW